MDNTKQNYVLIASTGKQDIKFWLKGLPIKHSEEGEKRLLAVIQDEFSFKGDLNNPEKDNNVNNDKEYNLCTREIHEKLRDGELPYEFSAQGDANTQNKIIDYSADILFYLDNDKKIKPKAFPKFDYTDLQVITDNEKYLLHAAKLEGLIQTLTQKQETNEITVLGALFLGTERDNNRDEPVASHVLLAKYFASKLSLGNAEDLNTSTTGNNPKTTVFWSNQLEDIKTERNARYEGTGLDYPVKRIIAKRIDDTVDQFLKRFDNNEAEVILSHTGGMADLKALLTASVRFRAPNHVLESQQTEKADKFDAETFDLLIKEKNYVSRQHSLEIKSIVKKRIIEGDFHGAWSACEHLMADQNDTQLEDEAWIQAVRWVAEYFKGQKNYTEYQEKLETSYNTSAEYQQFKSLLDHLQNITTNDTLTNQISSTLTQKMFQVEAKLQASKPEERDIISALIDCSTLSDQLLRVITYIHLDNNCNPQNKSLDFHNDQIPTSIIDSVRNKLAEDEKLKHYIHSPNSQRLIQLRNSSHWKTKLKNIEDYQFYFLFDDRIRAKNTEDTKPSLTDWRNKVAHQSLTIDDLGTILTTAIEENSDSYPVWNPELRNNKPLPTGTCFLNQYYVKEIEKNLNYDIGSTQQKYKKLQENLLEIVSRSIYVPEETNH